MGRRRTDDYEDEDEEEDERPARRSKRKNKTAPNKNRLPLIIGGVGLLAFLMIAGTAWKVYSSVKAARNAPVISGNDPETAAVQLRTIREAESFLNDFAGKSDGQLAYLYTTPTYQSTTTFAQFQQLADQTPMLKKHRARKLLTSGAVTGAFPKRKQTHLYELSLPPETGAAAAGPKPITISITMAEQHSTAMYGMWRVENFVTQ